MIASAASRCRAPILARVEDLERSPEWMALTYDINNLQRIKSLGGACPRKLEDATTATATTASRQMTSHSLASSPSPYSSSSSPVDNYHHQDHYCVNKRWSQSCKPQTEFERNYFGDSSAPDIDKVCEESDNTRHTSPLRKNSVFLNANVKDSQSFNDNRSPRASYWRPEHPKAADILFNPGSEEFRGSKDRLHEIFQHNRLLRRRFFGCSDGNTNLADENEDNGDIFAAGAEGKAKAKAETKAPTSESIQGCVDVTNTDNLGDIMKTRLELDTQQSSHVTSGFGSTETITSQSNQSVSSNGHKSRVDYDNSVEFVLGFKNREPFDGANQPHFNYDKVFAAYARVQDSLLSPVPPPAPLRKNKFLNDDSLAMSLSPDSCLRELEMDLEKFNEDLRSPQLVSSFSNSIISDGSSDRDGSEITDRGKSIDSTPGTGTTLPFVYGPIPYKSPRRYVEGEVTIHYRSPVRTEAKEILSEEELARRSAENMRRVYQEERRRKYLQELHDIDSRRHTDNFIPSQKSPIPLNRYDDFLDDLSYRSRSQEQTPEPRLVARAMYNFVGQTSRELSFRRGDIILIRRQIDKNWYEGEHNAMVGLFPLNYIEVLPFEGMRSTPKKPYEGQARARFNFIAQTNLELSLVKGELVVLTRRVDDNWFEGRIGNRKGIFPVTYVEVIMEPGQHRPETPVSSKPVASPAAHSMLSNGTASGKLSMGPHHYTPSIPVKTSTTEPQYISLPRIGVTERNKLHVAPVNETLHIDTHSDTLPYRALYNYRPQNEDELELKENDTVFVIEKCDDGWFVGSSQRTGYFGTFPGNYVERL